MPHKQNPVPDEQRPADTEGPLEEREREETRQAILRPGRVDPDSDKAQGKSTRGHDEVATRKHLQGAHQDPR